MGIDPTQPGRSSQDQSSAIARKENQGHLGSHNVSEIPKKGPLFSVANVIAKLAKVVFTAAFAIPIAVTLLASKKNYSFGSLGGKGDKLATKVRNFFVRFFHEKISGKLFGDVKFAKAELTLKSDYHAFIEKNNLTDYKSQLSTLLNSTLNLTFSEEHSKSTHKEELIKCVLTLPPKVREKLLKHEETLKKLSNGQLDSDELKKLKESSQYSSSLSDKINKKAQGGQPVSLKILVDFPKNMGLALYFRGDKEKSKKYKDLALSQLAELDPQTNLHLIEGLTECLDKYQESIFNSDHNIFSQEELTHIQDGFKGGKLILQFIQDNQNKLSTEDIETLKMFFKAVILYNFFESTSDELRQSSKNQKNNLMNSFVEFAKKNKFPSEKTRQFIGKTLVESKLIHPGERQAFENTITPQKDGSSKKGKTVRFNITFKKDYLVTFEKEKSEISSLVNQAARDSNSSSKSELINTLKEKITLFQRWCDAELTKDQVKTLLTRTDGESPFTKEEIKEIVTFVLRPKKDFESRYIADLNQIAQIINEAKSDVSTARLIPQLQVVMSGLQKCCHSKLTEEEIKELLKKSNGELVFKDEEIKEIIRFLS
jgi:hypothetical protein